MDTRIQYDAQARIVALSNLEAMCERQSGMCHRFWVETTRAGKYARLYYSNPNEYGSDRPFYAELPIVGNVSGSVNHEGCQLVMLDTVGWGRIVGAGDSWGGEEWQAFQPILDCPQLWRDPNSGKWQTRTEIETAKAG